jgi:hypothetical protein
MRLVRKVKGVGLAAAVVVGGLVVIHVVGIIFSVVATVATIIIPGALLIAFVYLMYKLFFKE